MLNRARLLSLLLGLAVVLTDAGAHAQSSAKAPPLDDSLRAMIADMTSLNGQDAPEITGRPLLITFFASWCPPCRPEFAELNRLSREFPETTLTLIAINAFEDHFPDKGQARMKRFLRQTGPQFAVLVAKDEAMMRRRFGNLDRIPTVYLYDAAGQPRHTFIHQQGASKTHVTADELIPVLRKFIPIPASD